MRGGYSNVASVYDSLSRVVFGKTLVQAQVSLLHLIPKNSTILIVGGGTGWLLEEIAKIHPEGLTIFYVEVAEKMLELSRKRNVEKNNIVFINDAIEKVENIPAIDIVITPFLFDNFLPDTADKVFEHIHNLLKPGGIWLNTDFQLTGKWWQKVLLKIMLVFFRIMARIESKQLPDIDAAFKKREYTIVAHKTFFGDFIKAEAYRKA